MDVFLIVPGICSYQSTIIWFWIAKYEKLFFGNLISSFYNGDCFSKVGGVGFFTSSHMAWQSVKCLNHSVIHLTHIYSEPGMFQRLWDGRQKEQVRALVSNPLR